MRIRMWMMWMGVGCEGGDVIGRWVLGVT
jgi:hypothetical protein